MSTTRNQIARAFVIALTASLLTGCLNTRNERIKVRSEEIKRKVAERAERLRPRTYEEIVTEKLDNERALELRWRLWTSMNHREDTTRAIDRIRATIPADPFESHDNELARVMNRPWTDVKKN